jgi:hypothetical protein
MFRSMMFDKHVHGFTAAEQWRAIPGFEGFYEVSDQGRVRGVTRTVKRNNHSAMTIKSKLLVEQYRPDTGYYVVKLSKNNRKRNYYIHRLVLMAFVGLPEEGQEACHENDVRTDNRLVNLRWDSHTANVQDAIKRNRMRNHNRERTHCKRGHPFDSVSTPGGRRTCYPCRRLNERNRYHKARNTNAA